MANIPAWAAELEEEWVESSPSSSHEPITLLETAESLPPITVNSIRAKRGSLRALGHAAPRGLPPSRSTSAKIISGHGEGRVLSERFENLSIEGVWSPPSSRSSSGLAGEVAGTFVVKKGVEDDRGKALARKGRDIFGPTALEKMFQPPSPPQPPQPQHAVPDDARRSSHPYAPANPSRLSMSVTPSTALSMTTSEVPTRLGGDEDSVLREDTVVREDVSGVPQQDFSFSYPAPHIAAGSTGTRSESGSGTVRGGSSRNKAPFQPSLDPLEEGEPSNSTIHDRPHRRKHPRNASSPRAGSLIPGLRLFRSTYDTYTRDHLSALVDSIAIEPSPSPPSMPDAQNLRDWSPSASLSGSGDGTGSGSSEGSDLRSSKRLRMSPVTPGRQEGGVRDWGAQRRAVYHRIRGREVERTASASLNGDHDDEDGPTIDYPANPQSPTSVQGSASPEPLGIPQRRNRRSNPSTTSFDYLRAAEELMAKIRAREVSESLSGIDGPADPVQRSTSSTGESSDWEGRVKPKGKTGPSPRRMLRRLSASEEIKRAADHSSGDDSPKASLRPIPATTSGAPLPPIRHEVDADNLARFVSATTIATSTTISTSFVKHAGPRAASRDRMRMIRPDEVDGLVPEKVGKMRYDKEGMRWVRDGLDKVDEAGESRVRGSEESEDVFAGMESWREEKAPQVVEDSSTSQGQDAGPSRLEGLHNEIEPPPQRPVPVHACSAPAILTPAPAGSGSLRPIRSALRNANSATPAGALKKRAGWHESVTPAGGSESKRSVSFSDGKKNGKMGDLFEGGGGGGERSWMPSARTKRIEGMLDDLEDLSLDDGTPSKPPRSFEPSNFSASQDVDQSYNPPVRASRKRSAADATFLTECSFGVTHDRLVQLITDVYGSEPWWDHLRSLNLRGKGADSVARLKEFLPELDEVVLDDNKISYLSGIPHGVRTLHVAGNRLTSLTSVDHLRNLQYLDISRNQLDSVTQLECLRHLRELKADNNRITDLSGIGEMDCLIKLSLAGNRIESLDLGLVKWQKLEYLNVSNNQLTSMSDLHNLGAVTSINLDGNLLDHLAVSRQMSNVRTVRLSDNDLSHLDLSRFPRLRTLYADGNRLTRLEHAGGRLENLSLRSQRSTGLRLEPKVFANIKRLYISGNPLSNDLFPTTPLYSLVYLEAAACKLSSLPASVGRNMPNLKILNVNYNFLDNLDALKGLKGLRKLTVIGNRLGGSGATGVVKGVKGLIGLEEVDLRMNPSTLGFYLPLLTSHSSTLPPTTPRQALTFGNITTATIVPLKPSNGPGTEWASLDASFRRALPDEWYSKRLVYRGLIMAACGKVRVLDGVRVEEGERRKAGRLLDAARRG